MKVLRDWRVQWAYKDRVSSKVVVEGVLDTGRLWRSSVIAKRVSKRQLETASGSLYVLQGPAADPLLQTFQDGFPKDWLNLLKTAKKRRETRVDDKKKEKQENLKQKEDLKQIEKVEAREKNEKEENLLQREKVELKEDMEKENMQMMNGKEKGKKEEKKGAKRLKRVQSVPAQRKSERLRNQPMKKEYCEQDEEDVRQDVLQDLHEEVLGVEKVERRTGLPWESDELRRLRRAHATCTAKPGQFWEWVASKVGSRTSQECYNQWCRVFVPRETSLQRRKVQENNEINRKRMNREMKPAGKETAKYRKQFRSAFQASEERYRDDLFESTPFKTKKNECMKDILDDVKTPKEETCKGEDSDEEKDEEEDSQDSEEDHSVDRDKVDYYIAGVRKRRKGDRGGGRIKANTKEHRTTEISVKDSGASGQFTPGGSVKVAFDMKHFSYEFSDEEDDDELFDE